jgi:hypothetical protein
MAPRRDDHDSGKDEAGEQVSHLLEVVRLSVKS